MGFTWQFLIYLLEIVDRTLNEIFTPSFLFSFGGKKITSLIAFLSKRTQIAVSLESIFGIELFGSLMFTVNSMIR